MASQQTTELSDAVARVADIDALTGVWAVDPVHSRVAFAVKHLGVGTIRGQFEQYEGKIEISRTPPSIRVASVIEAASINTDFSMRDEHLRSTDFFDVEQHPTLEFVSRKITLSARGEFEVSADLTVRGVTREITLSGTFTGPVMDQYDNERLAFHVDGQLSRDQFGMPYNQSVAGIPIVADAVQLVLDVEAIRQR